jgi:hypothetical protein
MGSYCERGLRGTCSNSRCPTSLWQVPRAGSRAFTAAQERGPVRPRVRREDRLPASAGNAAEGQRRVLRTDK